MTSKTATSKAQEIRLAHSPDSDDAFMFYALATRKVRTPGLKFTHVLQDIETLNQAARQETYDVTAISFHAYPFLADKYRLLDCGASFGEGYGPVVVARKPLTRRRLAREVVAIPGELTTAHLALKLWLPEVRTRVVPFDRILDEVAAGQAGAGVVIHEGQLTFGERGLQAVVDLGAWWQAETGGPLPLGGNGIRKDIDPALQARLCQLLADSIAYGLAHREETLDYAVRYARGLEGDRRRADRFVAMYVNEWTREYGAVGRRAVQELLERGHAAGVLPRRVAAEFVECSPAKAAPVESVGASPA